MSLKYEPASVPGVWERTDATRGRAALEWARVRSSLEKIVREKVEHARGRVAREQRERARVSAAPEIFARERHGQLRRERTADALNPPGHLWRDKWTALSGPLSGRPWTDVGFRRALEPLPPTLGNRKSSL